MARKKNKPNATGRNGNRVGSHGAVIILRRSIWLSPQVSALSPLARTLLVEMTAIYTGPKPEGADVFLSVQDAAARCGVSDHKAISSAFDELMSVRLITQTVASHFAVKAGGRSRARGFRLDWKTIDGGQATVEGLKPLDYKRLSDIQKRRVEQRSKALAKHSKNSLPVEDSTTLAAIRALAHNESVEDSTTLNPKNGSNALGSVVGDSSIHIISPGGAGAGPYLHRQSIKSSGPQIERRAAMFVAGSTDRFCRMVKLRRGHNIIEREAA